MDHESRENLRKIKMASSEKVWEEWSWMRREAVKDAITVGGVIAAGYLIVTKRQEIESMVKEGLSATAKWFFG